MHVVALVCLSCGLVHWQPHGTLPSDAICTQCELELTLEDEEDGYAETCPHDKTENEECAACEQDVENEGVPVRLIGHHIMVHKSVMDDMPMLQAIIHNQLAKELAEALDREIMDGRDFTAVGLPTVTVTESHADFFTRNEVVLIAEQKVIDKVPDNIMEE